MLLKGILVSNIQIGHRATEVSIKIAINHDRSHTLVADNCYTSNSC